LLAGDIQSAATELERTWAREGLDLITVTDKYGVVRLRVTNPEVTGDTVLDDVLVRAVLERAEAVAATVVVPAASLRKECPHIAERAYCVFVETPGARMREEGSEDAGLMLKSAAPILDYDENLIGVVYGGLLLNRRYDVVDKIKATVFRGERYHGRDIGTATIFHDDIRIATNVMREDGSRAVGTRVSEEVYNRVVREGGTWIGRAFVVNAWYISAYEPLRDYQDRAIGMLYVGILEKPYLDIQRRASLIFLAISLGGALLVIGLSYVISRRLSVPIKQLALASREIAGGNLDTRVAVSSDGELAEAAEAFNQMASALSRMKGDLEEWGRTLEAKVQERSEALVEMQARVSHSERLASLGMLAAGVAHEINNPLGGILALTGVALEDLPEDDPNRLNLEEVMRQCERCREIVKGLLEFSRQSQSGAEPVDINETLEKTLGLIEKQASFLNITLVKELQHDLPAVVGDRSQLEQVFMNVLMNAVQAMREEGTLTLVTRRGDDDYVEISIADTGCGISSEHIDHIFDPFYTTKSGEGTGLGLSIAYGIIAKHRGSISVESEVGRGTRFTIVLPVIAGFAGVAENFGQPESAVS
jgi:two-component system NtrC family sensor kinase